MKASAKQKKSKILGSVAQLRGRAESRLRGQRKVQWSKLTNNKSEADSARVLHELEVHQIELELQNTELQKTRDDLEVALEKATDLFDFAPVGYFSIDESGMILEANLMGAALLGLERSRLVNRPLRHFMDPVSQPILLSFLKRVFARNGKHVCEARLFKEGAPPFWASLHGISAISFSGSRRWCRVAVADITTVRLAEEILRRNEVLFTALIEEAPIGVYVLDAQLRMQQVNAKAQPIFRKIRPLYGRDFSEVIHILWPKKVADEIVKHFGHTLATGESYSSPEFSERRLDTGVEECYEWQIQRITLPVGEFGVVCFFNNTTQRKQAEAIQYRIDMLASSNQKLEQQIVRRQAGEVALRKSERHTRQLLKQSRQMEDKLRLLSRQILLAQENERKQISRELHDVIAQTLSGINIRLAALKKESATGTKSLERSIARTQLLVEKSVDIVHEFARELRPPVLDDLGLIPALHTFLKEFTARSGVRTSLTAFAAVEQLDTAKRTVLFRIAQEALTNVARHAKATQVEVSLQKQAASVCMIVKDDGKSFNVERTLHANGGKRLGLLGMRERIEMVGGTFHVESAPNQGTAIRVEIPLKRIVKGVRRKSGKETKFKSPSNASKSHEKIPA